MKKYAAIKLISNNPDDELHYFDTELHSMPHLYRFLYEVKDYNDFEEKKYRYKRSCDVIVNGVKMKIVRRISKHRYIVNNATSKGVNHIAYFAARSINGNSYVVYDYDIQSITP